MTRVKRAPAHLYSRRGDRAVPPLRRSLIPLRHCGCGVVVTRRSPKPQSRVRFPPPVLLSPNERRRRRACPGGVVVRGRLDSPATGLRGVGPYWLGMAGCVSGLARTAVCAEPRPRMWTMCSRGMITRSRICGLCAGGTTSGSRVRRAAAPCGAAPRLAVARPSRHRAISECRLRTQLKPRGCGHVG